MGGVVGVNLCAVVDVMEILDVEDRQDCLERIVYLSRELVAEMHERAKVPTK